jgi:protein disulfide-isomerase
MKLFFLALALGLVGGPLRAVEVGDTYEKVTDELGMPASKVETGGVLTLNYPDATIKLQEGKVAFIKMAEVESGNSYKQVVETKGDPASKMEAGISSVLRYTDATIKLRDGKVVSIKLAGSGEGITAVNGTAKAVSAVGVGEWTTDYAAALSQARATKKTVFLFFTGSDWCGWCKRLDKEVLSTSDFKTYARANLILVKLDFPHDIPQAAQLKARNQKLAQQYGVDGFPTIVVLNSAGKNVGTLGYMEGGPRAFLKELKKF